MVTERHEYLADAWQPNLIRRGGLGKHWHGMMMSGAGTLAQVTGPTPRPTAWTLCLAKIPFTHPSHRKATRILQRTTLRLLLESLSSPR